MIIKLEKNPLFMGQNGMTLVELLFIIVIVGILSVIMVNSFRQRTENIRIEKTALQMQQILQAAITYRLAQGCWPASGGSAPIQCNSPSQPNFINTYLPVMNTQGSTIINPWQRPYSFTAIPPTQPFVLQSGSLGSQANAQRVAGLLPNSTASGGIVTTQISLDQRNAYGYPGVPVKTISSTGWKGPNDYIPIPLSCPGKQAYAATMIKGIQTARYYKTGNIGFCPTGSGPISYLNSHVPYLCPGNNCSGGLYYASNIPLGFACLSSEDNTNGAGSADYAYIGWCQ